MKALSNASNDPPTKGLGGFGSLAIHHPTGILTAFKPFSDMNLKSSSVMYVLQWSYKASIAKYDQDSLEILEMN